MDSPIWTDEASPRSATPPDLIYTPIAVTSVTPVPTIYKPGMDIYTSSVQPWDHMNPALPKIPKMPPMG